MFRALALSLPITVLLLAASSGVLLAPSTARAQLDLATPGEVSQALSGSMLWPSPVIRVCFENGAMSDPIARDWIREAAEGTWEAVSNVDFVGWGFCTANDTASIHVGRRTDGANFTYGLGTQLAGATAGMQLTFDYPITSACAGSPGNSPSEKEEIREACIRSNAVHEFGHALGFAHEHLRDDAGVLCETGQADPGTGPEMIFTDYDAESVMNYCASNAGVVNSILENGGVELTPLDVAGVRVAYGPWEDGVFISVQIEGYIEGQDNYFGGHERGERDFDLSLNVGNGTLATATQTMCLGSGNLQVQVDLAASPLGPNGLTVAAEANLFAGPTCGDAPNVDTETASFPVGVGPNGTLAQWQEMWLSAGSPADWGHVRLMVYRGFDLEAALESCENCEEIAANNAVPITTVVSSGFVGGRLPYIATPLACLSLRGCEEAVPVQTLFPVREVIDHRPAPPRLGETPLTGGIVELAPSRQLIPAAWLRHTPAAEPTIDATVPLDERETLGADVPVADEPELPSHPIVVVSGAQKVKIAGVGKVLGETAFAFRIGEGWWDAVEPFGRALGGGWRERGKKGGSLRLDVAPQFEATLAELISEGTGGAIDAAAVSVSAPPKLQLKVRKDGTVATKMVVAFEAEVDGQVRRGKYVAKLVGEVR